MTFYIESLGCAKNRVDSEVIIASLEKSGLFWVNDPDIAELIIINTCGFITSAKEESILTSLEIKRQYPTKKVIMTGCLVRRYEEDLKRELKEIDGFTTGSINPEKFALNIAQLIKESSISTQKENIESILQNRRKLLSFPGSAFVKVSEGCSNCCSYCAIPMIRGPMRSRLREDIMHEIKNFLDIGIYEINLIAQDLCSFGLDRGGAEIEELLKEISALPGEFWLRLLYLHPDHFPESILDIIGKDTRLLPYFDIPFQHASENVLTRMGRSGSKEIYLALIRKIRERLRNAVIRSTFLVGFPGETDEDFNALLDFQRQSSLDWMGVFTYSSEEGTKAESLSGRVSQKTARMRRIWLEEAQASITQKHLDSLLGRSLEVLVEESVREEKLYLARAYLQAPDVDGLIVLRAEDLEPGQHLTARIMRRNGIDLEGVPCHAS